MADTGMLDALWSMVGPREAEAKVLPAGPDERALLTWVARQNQKGRGQYLPDMQQRILERAQAHPQAVTLLASPGMGEPNPADPFEVPATAEFDPQRGEIRYDPTIPAVDLPNTLAHELLHFLNWQSARRQGVAAQHALIQQLLGTNVYKPAAQLRGYQPGALSPVEHDIIRSWLGGGF